MPGEPVREAFFVERRSTLEGGHADGTPPPGDSNDPEGLGALPDEYPEELALLLPRDPFTLFLAWNFPEPMRVEASQGLERPRAIVRIWEGPTLVREVEFALEMRSYYFHGMKPGRTYRADLLFQGADGRTRRIGTISPRATLPPSGPSADTTVRFMRMAWETPIAHSPAALERARIEENAIEYVPLDTLTPHEPPLPWSGTRPVAGSGLPAEQRTRPSTGMPQLSSPRDWHAPWNASGSGKGISSLQRTWSTPSSSQGEGQPHTTSRSG